MTVIARDDLPADQIRWGGQSETTPDTDGAPAHDVTPPSYRRTDTPDDRPRASQADRLVALAHELGAELWHTAGGDAHMTVPIADHHETYPLASRACRDWLSREYHAETARTPRAQALADALGTLSGLARYSGVEHEVSVRVAGTSAAVYLDLGTPDCAAVEITATGWRVVADPPVRFRRPRGLLALPRPVSGGSIDALRALLNVASDADWRLLVAWELGAIRTRGPYPVLSLSGEQGAAKSTVARMLRGTIDPSQADLRAEPREIRDLMIAASSGWIVALDNVSRLSDVLSDGLCRLSTGGALGARQLYTDGDEVILAAQRPVILTGIAEVATRGDLLDRCLSVTLPPLDDAARRTEAELWARYEAIRPGVLGALLDAVACALAHEHETRLARLPRMADWCRWATAAEPALGWARGSVLAAYTGSRQEAIEHVLDGDRIATAIRGVALPWTGTAGELLTALEHHAGIDRARPPHGWPQSPRGLVAALRRLAPQLRRVGVDVTTGDRTGHERRRTITIAVRNGDPPDETVRTVRTVRTDRIGPDSDASVRTVAADDPADRPRIVRRPSADRPKANCQQDLGLGTVADDAADADGSIPLRTPTPAFDPKGWLA